MIHFYFVDVQIKSLEDALQAQKYQKYWNTATQGQPEDTMVEQRPHTKYLNQVFTGPRYSKTLTGTLLHVTNANGQVTYLNVMKCLKTICFLVKYLTCGVSISWAHSPFHLGINTS